MVLSCLHMSIPKCAHVCAYTYTHICTYTYTSLMQATSTNYFKTWSICSHKICMRMCLCASVHYTMVRTSANVIRTPLWIHTCLWCATNAQCNQQRTVAHEQVEISRSDWSQLTNISGCETCGRLRTWDPSIDFIQIALTPTIPMWLRSLYHCWLVNKVIPFFIVNEAITLFFHHDRPSCWQYCLLFVSCRSVVL